MQNLEKTSEELFAKIRGRFPSVTIGTEEGAITNNPSEARFIEFDYKSKGKVSLSLDEDDGLVIMHGADILAGENEEELSDWYSFLKELRVFAKKRMLNFDIRDITKSNLNKRDYNFLAKTSGEENMTESKMYGTSRMSYQDVDSARLVVKHTGPVNQELASGRTKSIGAIYIESAEGERFKYPFKHLSAARAMARHVAEGGKPFDDFGNHITSLSEELSKLRKFKTYMGRSAVMAEGLEPYMDAVKERMTTVKKTIESLQKQKSYKEMVENFEIQEVTEVPEDIRENWIEQLTIKQFNEELQDVFPYIYKLVGEATLAEELGPEDLLGEAVSDCDETCPKSCPDCGGTGDPEKYKKDQEVDEAHGNSKEYDKCWDGYKKVPGKKRGEKGSCVKEEDELERGFEEMMGQFAEDNDNYVGAVEYHDGTTIYPKIGDTVELFYSDYTDSDDEADHKPNAVGKIVGKGKRDDDTFIIKWKDNTTGNIEQDEFSAVDEFKILNKDRSDPSRIKGRKQGELPMPGGKTNRRNVRNPAGTEEDTDGRIDTSHWHSDDEGDYAYDDEDEDDTDEAGSIEEPKEQKTPLGEFILSYYDRETGEFPKGETAVLTMVEKDYGEQFIEPAKAFIESVNQTFEAYQQSQPTMSDPAEHDRMRELAGLR